MSVKSCADLSLLVRMTLCGTAVHNVGYLTGPITPNPSWIPLPADMVTPNSPSAPEDIIICQKKWKEKTQLSLLCPYGSNKCRLSSIKKILHYVVRVQHSELQ